MENRDICALKEMSALCCICSIIPKARTSFKLNFIDLI